MITLAATIALEVEILTECRAGLLRALATCTNPADRRALWVEAVRTRVQIREALDVLEASRPATSPTD